MTINRPDGRLIDVIGFTHRTRDSERTKETILIAAERLIAEKGVHALTLDEVAARGSVSKGGLLHHFASKRALIDGLAARMIALYDADIDERRKQDPAAPGAYTRALMRAGLASLDECSRICAALSAECRDFPEMLARFQAHSAHCDRMLAADGLDPLVASTVRYATDGLMLAARWGMPKPANYEALVQHLLELAGGKKTNETETE